MASSRPYRDNRNFPISINTLNVSSRYEEDPFPYHLNNSDQLKWCINRWVGRWTKSPREIVYIINRLVPGLLQDPRRTVYDKCHIINGILFDYFFYVVENGAADMPKETRMSKL